MSIEQQEQFDLTKPLRVIFQRKWLIASCLIGVLFSIITLNQISTPIYKADTTIVFEEKQGPSASINPFKISLTKSFITNQIEEIKSRSLSEEVVENLPENVINTFPLPKEQKPNFNKEALIALQIQESIDASSVPNSEIIKIEIEAYSPIAAKVIVNTIAEVLKKRNQEVRREETSNVRKIIEEQLQTFKKQLDNAEITLKKYKEESKVTVIDKEAEEIFKRITEAEIVYNQSKANLDAAKKRFAFIQEKLAAEREDLVPSITKITSPWAQKLKKQLVDLEVQYTTLKVQDYSEDHPKMVKLKEQIEQTKKNLKEESLKIAAGENIVDPISQIQKFMEESITLEIEIQTYQAQEKALREVIDNYKSNLNTLPDKELRLAQLLRDKEVNEKVYMMLLQKREEAKITEAERVGNIRIIDPAKIPENPVKPRKFLNLMLGFILGTFLGVGLAFLLEYLDNTVKTVEDAERLTKYCVLGTIPKIKTNMKKVHLKARSKEQKRIASEMSSKLITEYNPKSPEAEAFRMLRTNLQFAGIDSPLKTILITSPNPNDGKSLIVANLSITTAQMGLKTLLIDADLRKPILHNLFQKEIEPGFINILTSKKNKFHKVNYSMSSIEQENILDNLEKRNSFQNEQTKEILEQHPQTLNTESYIEHYNIESLKSSIQHTNIHNLDLLLCGMIPPNPSEILASTAMKNMLLELRTQYDAIFIDTPPINVVTDAIILCTIVDATILVIKVGSSSEKEIQRATKLLQRTKSKTIGLVVNNIDTQDGYSSYYYYNYHDNNNGKS